METIDHAWFVLEKTRELSRMDGSILAQVPGWNRAKACRYLNKLTQMGLLQRINPERGYPVYILGPRAVAFALDTQRF